MNSTAIQEKRENDRFKSLDDHQGVGNYWIMTTKAAVIVAYYRVSTKTQGASGLGLEAQRESVAAYARSQGATILAEYTEIESGRNSDRPQLADALAHARLARAILVVAKLDRLSRNVRFISTLMESKVEFIACDNPHANSLTLHILAAMAEHEAKAISQRTKDALAAAKKDGVKLGSARPGHWVGREDRRKVGSERGVKRAAEALKKATSEAYKFLLPKMTQARLVGRSLSEIASDLNDLGYRTRAGKPWNAVSVMRVLRRAA